MFQQNNGGKRTPQMPLAPSKNRQALSASLAKMTDEEARRRIKVGTKCMELQQMLESQGCYTCEEITTKVEAFRSLLLRQNQPSAFPLLPFVYQTLLQPAQLLLDQLKVPQVSAELLQRSGILKNDVYAIRSNRLNQDQTSTSRGRNGSRARHSRGRRRRSRRHKRRRRDTKSRSRSWSRSRSRSSPKTDSRRRCDDAKLESPHVDRVASPPKVVKQALSCVAQVKKMTVATPGPSTSAPLEQASQKASDNVVDKPKKRKHQSRSRSPQHQPIQDSPKRKSKKKKSKKKKKKKRRKSNKNGNSEETDKNVKKGKSNKQRKSSNENEKHPEMGSFVSEDNSNKIVIESIEDLPTINSDDKIKPKVTLTFNKVCTNNNISNPLEKKKPPVRTCQILNISTPSINKGKQSRLRNASKWDDKVLRNPNAPKNLKFPKCLPPLVQPDAPIDVSRQVNGDEKKVKSQSPEKEKRRSRYDSRSSQSSGASHSRSRSYSSYTSWSRSSSSRSWSRTVSRSSSRSRSKSRSVPKRNASPSFMERRRITSARKRPIPYKRKDPFNCRSSRSSSYSHSSYSSRSWSSRSRSRSRSRTRSRSRSRSRTWSRSSYSTSRSRSRSFSRSTSYSRDSWSRSRSRSP